MSVNAAIPSAPTCVPRSAIGSHVAVGGGLVRAGLGEAAEVGAEVIQLFASNPRAWRPSRVDPDVDALFRERCAELAVPVFVHASHLINLGSPSDETLESSIALLGHTLRRAADLGARGVVVHAGTSVSRGRRDAALAKLHGIVGRLLDEAHEGVQLLIEPTSGGGEALASTVDSAIEYLAALDDDRVGVCLDTCHLHAAGDPMNTGAGVQQTMSKVAARIGAERVGLIHVNDSRDARGSRRDRHESLGSGQIGAEAFTGLFLNPVLAGVPMVVETPSHREDVAFLKQRRTLASVQ